MPELSSSFTRDDVDTLIEAMGDWESLGNQEYQLLQMIKSAPMPPEDHEAFEYMQQIKDYFKNREKDINLSRLTRQEKAVFLKAKLMMVRRELDISQLFEMSSHIAPDVVKMPAIKESVPNIKSDISNDYNDREKLEASEYFIKDLGVWSHYQDFLAKKGLS